MHNVHDSQMTMQLTSEFRISQACSKGYATTHRWCRGRHHRWGCRGCEQGVDEVGVCAKVLSKAVSDVEYWMGRLLNLKGNNPTGALNPRTRAWVELTNACMCVEPSNTHWAMRASYMYVCAEASCVCMCVRVSVAQSMDDYYRVRFCAVGDA